MVFSDPIYIFVFLPLAVSVFYTAARRGGKDAGMLVLAGSSMLFYSAWDRRFTAIFLASMLVNFLVARTLAASDDDRSLPRRVLWVGCIVFDLAVLVWFKSKALSPALAALDGVGDASLFDLALPVGISFYTVQQAVFVHDAYKRADGVRELLGIAGTGGVQAQGSLRGLLRYVVFISFFPQLVIGPITYLREFRAGIGRASFGRLRRIDIEVGCALLAIGLFKKLVMADNLAIHADRSFSLVGAGLTQSSIVAIAGSLAFYAQLYFDFSGYSDMALGSARLFGIRLPVNFLSPLKATGIADFYRRWHITLTRVASRFVYTPVSIVGARWAARRGVRASVRSLAVAWLPLMLNFLLIALWHGTNWTFVVFGLVHGAWYVAEQQVTTSKGWRAWVGRFAPRTREIAARAFFFVPMMLCFSLFRSENLDQFLAMVSAMCSLRLEGASGFALYSAAGWIFAAFAVILFLPNSVELTRRYRPGFVTWPVQARTPASLDFVWRADFFWGMLTGMLFLASLGFMNRQAPFLYMGF